VSRLMRPSKHPNAALADGYQAEAGKRGRTADGGDSYIDAVKFLNKYAWCQCVLSNEEVAGGLGWIARWLNKPDALRTLQIGRHGAVCVEQGSRAIRWPLRQAYD